VAFSADLGVAPVEAEVVSLCRAAAGWWTQQGVDVVEAAPDLQDMQQVFLVRCWWLKPQGADVIYFFWNLYD